MSDPASDWLSVWLSALGIKLPVLFAGFAGGVVNAIAFRRSDPWSVASSVVVGALTAAYLGEPFAAILRFDIGPCAFIVGVAGMAITQGIVAAFKNWRLPLTGGPGQS
jgi:zinc transporter ZupT